MEEFLLVFIRKLFKERRVKRNNKMTIYRVKAKFDESKAKEFHGLITGWKLKAQIPDGNEIIRSMKRAKIDSSGLVKWTELCYCPTPLKHERGTVYDKYFTDIATKEIEDHEEVEGKPFLEHISKL